MTTKKVTIKDIAKETGFTAQAVSRALRNKEDISEKTKEIIRRTAENLGYVKNTLATSLRNGKSNTVAIVYDNITNPYFSIMTRHLQYFLKAKGYVLLIFTADAYFLDLATFNNIVSHNVAGIISFLDIDTDIAELALQQDLPIVVLGRKSIDNVSWITTAEKKSGSIAAKYLLEHGCKNILHITYSLYMVCGKERYDGFIEEIRKAGLNDTHLIVLVCTPSPLREVLPQYLKDNKIDGIFAFNDMLAYETLDILREENITDVKVVGIDNIQEMFRLPVKITTIGGDKKAMAQTTVDVLLEEIENKNVASYHRVFDVFLSEV